MTTVAHRGSRRRWTTSIWDERTEGVAAVPRDDVVRHVGLAAVGARRSGQPPVHPARRSSAASTSSTPPTSTRSASAKRSSAARSATSRAATSVVIATKVFYPLTRSPERRRPVAQAHHAGDRRLAAPPRHRLRRPLPDPPVRSATRRSRRRSRRCTTWSRPARRATSAPRACSPGSSPRMLYTQRLHGWTRVRVDAEPLQPDLPRGRARDEPVVPGRRHRSDSLEPAGARLPGRQPAARPARTRPCASERRLRPQPLLRRRRLRRRRSRRRGRASERRRCRFRSRWPGCCASRPCRRRSSASPSSSNSSSLSPDSRFRSPTPTPSESRSRIPRIRCSDICETATHRESGEFREKDSLPDRLNL